MYHIPYRIHKTGNLYQVTAFKTSTTKEQWEISIGTLISTILIIICAWILFRIFKIDIEETKNIENIPVPTSMHNVYPYSFAGKFLGTASGTINGKKHLYKVYVTTTKELICYTEIDQTITTKRTIWDNDVPFFESETNFHGCLPHNKISESLVNNIPGRRQPLSTTY